MDLQNQVNYAYNIAQDPSGLYLSLICDVKEEQKRENKSNEKYSSRMYFEIYWKY